MKVLSIIGTRPEAIKMAPVIHALEREQGVTSRVCSTGQHRELLDQMLGLFGLKPDHDLGIMRPRQSPDQVTCSVLSGLAPVLERERPDWVLVQGDTTTVMAASLAAFWRQISVGHVEAGLRTFDKYSPFPEEVNRRMAGVIADLHFAPTSWAADNLRREGVPEEHIVTTGNTGIDSLQHMAELPFAPAGTALEAVPFDGRRVILVTAHRAENFGHNMHVICRALRDIAERWDDVHLAYPVHLNPQAREAAYEHLADLPNVSLLPPLDYQPLVWLMRHSHFVITDSGGIQEEAAGLSKPVLVLRETTERPEAVRAGTATLVGARADEILLHARRLLDSSAAHESMATVPNPYGDGHAASRIVSALRQRGAASPGIGHVYERPMPEHPLDGLLRHATEGLPPQYREHVRSRFERRRRERTLS